MKTVLFVCTGNTCRSPMAEALLKRRLASLALPEPVQVFSAGTCAAPGAPASEGTLTVLAERGIDGRAHLASQVDRELISGADLILTMESRHKSAVLRLAPEARWRTFTLGEFATGDDAKGVSDPAYHGDYHRTRDELEELVAAAIDRLPEFFGWTQEGGAHA